MTIIQTMDLTQFDRIMELDRSEDIRERYVYNDGKLELIRGSWTNTGWTLEGEGAEATRIKFGFWRECLEEGGTMLGGFDSQEPDKLLGFTIYKPVLTPGVALMAALHVSRDCRGKGLGRKLLTELLDMARSDGAESIYISSSPSRITVDFYRSFGFAPVEKVHPELFRLEPNDIHMTLDL